MSDVDSLFPIFNFSSRVQTIGSRVGTGSKLINNVLLMFLYFDLTVGLYSRASLFFLSPLEKKTKTGSFSPFVSLFLTF